MSLSAGQRLGHFAVIAPLGAGGMGEVYRARDHRLGREVALKVLPASFAGVPDRRGRFEHEARVLAALEHPNIAAIHGFEQAHGVHFLVLELVEGRTLGELGRLEIATALELFRQIAGALEWAHSRSIVHRDLKPANVKVTPEGQVKVLDFGLAKVLELGAQENAMQPTLSLGGTVEGLVLGTPSYMSPEQARGQPADRRADIWAFGCCLFEALAGRLAFPGATSAERMAAVLSGEPEWRALPTDLPPRIAELVRRCLRKDPRQRMQDLGDARIAIEEALGLGPMPDDTSESPSPLQPRRRRVALVAPWILVAALAALVLADRTTSLPKRVADSVAPSRFELTGPDLTLDPSEGTGVAVAPNGRTVAFVASHPEEAGGGGPRIYLRTLDQTTPVALAGTEGGWSPFFSPGGESVGFFAGRRLMRVAIRGGSPQEVCSVTPVARGGSWGPSGVIVLAPGQDGGLAQVPADGGALQPLTDVDRTAGEFAHLWPQVLPRGHGVVFTIRTHEDLDDALIAVKPLDGSRHRVLLRGGTHVRFAMGHLIFARAGTLFAVPFDEDRLELGGSPVPAISGVASDPRFGVAHFDVAQDGTLIYAGGTATGPARRLLWVDRRGTAVPLGEWRRSFIEPRISPRGDRAAVVVEGPAGHQDVWAVDLERATLSRITSEPTQEFSPVWSRDGSRLAVAYTPAGARPTLALMTLGQGAGGEGSLSQLMPSIADIALFPGAFIPEGGGLVYTRVEEGGNADLWQLSNADNPEITATGDHAPRPWLATPYDEFAAVLSPNGRFVAYVSDESGRNEVYARPFPGPGARVLVSIAGGTSPLWSRGGRELVYRNNDDMMAVEIAAEVELRPGKPRLLFRGHYDEPARPDWPRNFDVTADGEKFLMVESDTSRPGPVTVVLHWDREIAAARSPARLSGSR